MASYVLKGNGLCVHFPGKIMKARFPFKCPCDICQSILGSLGRFGEKSISFYTDGISYFSHEWSLEKHS